MYRPAIYRAKYDSQKGTAIRSHNDHGTVGRPICWTLLFFSQKPSIKNVCRKSWKFTPPPLSKKCLHWLNPPPLSVRIHHKFWKFDVFCEKNADVRIWKIPLPLSEKMSALGNPHDCVRFSYRLILNLKVLILAL